MELTPIRARAVTDAVYQQLRDAILSGQLAAGHVLPGERKLCEALQVNRGALREALKRLDQDRLVAIHRGEGTRVLDFRRSARLDLLSRLIVTRSGELDSSVARSVAELRCAVLPDIARLAAARRSDDDVASLEQVVEEMRGAVELPARFQERVASFWDLLAEASRNLGYRLLSNTLRELYLAPDPALRSMLGHEISGVDRYAAIAGAIERRDGTAAAAAVRHHVERTWRSLGVESPAA